MKEGQGQLEIDFDSVGKLTPVSTERAPDGGDGTEAAHVYPSVNLAERAREMLDALDKTLAANRNGSIVSASRSPRHKDKIEKLGPESIVSIKGSESDLSEQGFEAFCRAFGAEAMKMAMIESGMHPDDAEGDVNNSVRTSYYRNKDNPKDESNFIASFTGPKKKSERDKFRRKLRKQLK